MLKKELIKVSLLLAVTALLLAACGGGNVPEATATVDVGQVQTQAVETFSANLTVTALAAPSNTPEPTQTLIPTIQTTLVASTPFTGTTPGVPVSGGATTSCYGLTFVQDVTIPDNTPMTPGKTFTKTWKVQNSGSCAWDAGFKFQSTGGDVMGATAFTLPASVASGATYDISVPMTAPNTPGTVRGNWRMSTAGGQFFGDEVFVVINVGGGGGAAATNTPASSEPTATPTQ